ncbi:hypothetical protein C8J57DRAFT_445682 [Mycena rebaudengoi]|nr:hypothetical protein C8J57DRAFT_445682 [Mycena rebaudengoi]
MAETTTELRAQLAKIGEEEAVLQAKLRLLAEERQSILRRLDAVVYPVLTLPSDVMAEIFMHYVYADTSVVKYDYSLRMYPPLLLASVCRTWRGIALSFPHLWAALSLERYSKSRVKSCEQLLQCWLLRAGGCLIDLELFGEDLPEPISEALAQHAPRLRSLNLMQHLGSQLSDSPATQQPQRCFTALETLKLRFQWRGFSGSAVTAFSYAPRLREVHISEGVDSWATLPWNQIAILDLYHSAPSRRMLKQAPNLEVLSFAAWDGEIEGPDEPVLMTKLHTLKMHYSAPLYNCRLFDRLTVPALRALDIQYDQDIEPLRSLISRSSCALQELYLRDRTAEETISCLEVAQSVEHLTIEFGDDWRERFREEADRFEAESRYYGKLFFFLERGQLPALKSLSFLQFPMAVDTASLQSMLSSRRETRGVANLESFRLVFADLARGYKEDDVYALRALVDDGLNIYIE